MKRTDVDRVNIKAKRRVPQHVACVSFLSLIFLHIYKEKMRLEKNKIANP